MDSYNAHDKSWEPMDVDISGNSAMSLDVSCNETAIVYEDHDISYLPPPTTKLPVDPVPIVQLNDFNKQTFLLQRTSKVTKKSSNRLTFLHIILINTVIMISILVYKVSNLKCSEEIKVADIKIKLENNLFGQTTATRSILTSIEANVSSKILFFYGGTGVGKSYASSLMIGSLKEYSNLYHYTMPTFKDKISSELLLGTIMCKTSLVIVDDLHLSDTVTTQVKEIIERSVNAGNKITVILIYTCDNKMGKDFFKPSDRSCNSVLKEDFKDVNVSKYYIKFEPLNEEHLMRCIEVEIKNKNLDSNAVNKVLKSFNVTLDGCKGVHTRMKLLKP